jgi:PAS domain S-box-containing protein
MTEVCGISVEAHLGRSVRELIPDLADRVENIVGSILRTGEPVTGIEVSGQRADKVGEERCWLTSWHPLKGAEGNIVAINVAAEEITERKRADRASQAALRASDERWRSVFECSTLGILLCDQDFRLVATNTAFQEMVGYAEHELQLRSPLDLLPEGDRDEARTRMNEIFEGKEHHYEVTRQLSRKDGSVVFAKTYVSRVPSTEASRSLLLATVVDVTARMQAETALHEAQADLARAARLMMMGELAASIAHEINQPLMGVVTFGQSAMRWLGSNPPNIERANASVKSIIDAGNRASDVIGRIRTLLKSDKPKYVSLDINETIREVIALAEGTLRSRGVAVHSYLAANLPSVLGDRVQLQQVVMNLLINGADAMKSITDQPKILRVGSKRVEGNVIVAIEDFGSGVDPVIADRIFTPLFTTKESGMGMGLSICRSIVDAHGGHIWLTPGCARGAIFQFRLPTHEASHSAPQA